MKPFEEQQLDINGVKLFIRKRLTEPSKPAILVIHGRGDSGLSWEFLFNSDHLNEFNIIIPDLPGSGKSKAPAEYYSYEKQVEILKAFIEKACPDHLHIIGHCMGGNLASLLLSRKKNDKIKSFICVEANLTEYDVKFAVMAVDADENGNYESWYREELLPIIVKKSMGRHLYGKLYYESLLLADPAAFLLNAREIVERNRPRNPAPVASVYTSLKIPKIFVYGTESLAPQTLELLLAEGEEVKPFDKAGHFPHIDFMDEFTEFTRRFILKNCG